MMTDKKIRLVLLDDHQVVREGVRTLLAQEPDLEVLGEASTAQEMVALCESVQPDVGIFDISLKGPDGLEALKQLRRTRPDIRPVVLTMHDDAATLDRALRAGARGYVLKGAGVRGLCEAIRQVMRDEAYLSPQVSHFVLRGYLKEEDNADPLTDRERQVLNLISEGFTGREIAEQLGLRPKTVENHRAHIMSKLGIHTTAGLVRYALSSQPPLSR